MDAVDQGFDEGEVVASGMGVDVAPSALLEEQGAAQQSEVVGQGLVVVPLGAEVTVDGGGAFESAVAVIAVVGEGEEVDVTPLLGAGVGHGDRVGGGPVGHGPTGRPRRSAVSGGPTTVSQVRGRLTAT